MLPLNGFFEGVSSIADASGNLMFYTDGSRVWNRNHTVMANGFTLMGSYTSSQAALIIKQPGNSNIYFIFTTQSAIQSPSVGLRYSVVDMNLAAGLGSVTVLNTLLYPSTTERLCATRHCNGTDIWVLTHEYPGNNFYAHLVTASGVSSSPVISSVGYNIPSVLQGQSSMKISPTGKKVITGCYTAGFEVYDFDNSTGLVSNAVPLGGRNGLNVEISPDGSKCYGVSIDTIKQWDLCAGSPTAIRASRFLIKAPAPLSQLQLAPNGKIYAILPSQQVLSVIHNPNVAGAGCNYAHAAQSIAPQAASYGFPQFLSSYFLEKPASFTFSNTPGCLSASFTSPAFSNVCPQVTYSISAMIWNFDDPASGATNTSTLSNPSHTFSAPGIYTVQTVLYNECGFPLDTLKQQLTIGGVPLMSNAGFSICAGESLTLSTSGASSYTWSTGATTSSILITPPASTTISVSGTNAWGCVASSTQSIVVNPLPLLSINGPTLICADSVTLTASGASSYSWSNGSLSAGISTSVAAVYTVTGTSATGCVAQKTISLSAGTIPNIIVSGNTTVCAGSPLAQTASGASSYTWSSGETFPDISIITYQNTTYTVYGTLHEGCRGSQTVAITAIPFPTLNISGIDNTCPLALVTQTASGAVSYTWSNGTFNSTVALAPAATTIYTVTGSSGGACNSSSTLAIRVNSVSMKNIRICSGEQTTLTAISPESSGFSYNWYPGQSSDSSIVVTPSVTEIFTVVASLPHCTTSATGTIIVSDCTQTLVSCEGSSAFSLPNAFSPNGDGRNDMFCLQGWSSCVTSFMVEIFNRWGEKVFESYDPGFCWDGIYKGKLLDPEVFVFVIRAETETQSIHKKGNISLIR